MLIILVEDDHNQAAHIQKKLSQQLPAPEFLVVKTESQFMERVSDFESLKPDLFVIDVMLRWTWPSPNQSQRPKEVKEKGRWRAGIRCKQRLERSKILRSVPCILYTILTAEDLGDDLKELTGTFLHLQKDSDLAELVEKIGEVV